MALHYTQKMLETFADGMSVRSQIDFSSCIHLQCAVLTCLYAVTMMMCFWRPTLTLHQGGQPTWMMTERFGLVSAYGLGVNS